MKIAKDSQKSISEIDFRIEFRSNYGIDYLDAKDKIKQFKMSSDREWHQVLLKHNLIS